MAYSKEERRQILDGISNWNYGILPNGQLASEHCFVHDSVPEIKSLEIDKDNIEDIIPIATKSEWTRNLVKSNVYKTPNDNSTINSLSLCKSVFKNESIFKTDKSETIHYVQNNPTAYVQVSKIARLTTDFEEELKIAEYYWPIHPQKSWDSLCKIWYKYGFLWPEYLYLDSQQHNDENLSHHSKSQDHEYFIIWRTHLRPIYDFFPNNRKEFIVDIIQYFSTTILNGAQFKLKNVKTGNYLGRQKQYDQKNDEIIMIESDSFFVEPENANNTVWSFEDRMDPTIKYRSPYVCADSKKILYSSTVDQDAGIIEISIIDKASRTTPSPNLRIVNHYFPINTPFNKIYIDSNWQWSIKSVSALKNSKNKLSSVCSMDQLIDQSRYLSDGDEIILSQNNSYLCEINNQHQFSPVLSHYSSKDNSLNYSHSPGDSFNKPPSSITTNRELYNFSSIVDRSASNSTLPTTGSDKSLPTSFNKINPNIYNPHITYAGVKTIDNINIKYFTDECRWKIELLTDDTQETESSDIVDEWITSCKYDETLNHQKEVQNSETIMISSLVQPPLQMDKSIIKQVDTPIPSQWLDGNSKLYDLKKNLESPQKAPENVLQSNHLTNHFDNQVASVKSIPSDESFELPIVSEKKLGKQPLKETDIQDSCPDNSSSSSEESDEWSDSPEPSPTSSRTSSTPKYKNPNIIQNDISEAEVYKRKIQEQFVNNEEEANAFSAIYQKMASEATPVSNSTSQIRYYDDDDNMYRPNSTSFRTYTMTPRSRVTPSSSANLTPEEYNIRKKSRESSFMMLVKPETKQEILIRAMKQSTLSSWIQSLSLGSKRTYHIPIDVSEHSSLINQIPSRSIQLQQHDIAPKIIQKKKGFYHDNSGRRNNEVTI